MEKGLSSIVTAVNNRGKHWLEVQIEEGLKKGDMRPSARNYFYAGWAGQCPRYIQAAMKAELPWSPMKFSQRKAFEYGTIAHERYQNAVKLIVTNAQVELPIRYTEDGITIHGKADLITESPTGSAIGCEIKTISGKEFRTLESPKEEHICQLTIYLHHLKLNSGLIIYENKDDTKWTAFLPELKIFDVVYSPERYQGIINGFKHVVECNKEGRVADAPEICPNGYCEIKCKK